MTRRDKKGEERWILDLIYGDRSIQDIQPSERPDFLLRPLDSAPWVGVEITQHYLTETDARLERIPGYAADLLNGGKYKHKDDPSRVAVHTFSLFSESNEAKGRCTGLLRELPSLLDYSKAIATIIQGKSAKCVDYLGSVPRVNLIIFDHSDLLYRAQVKDLYSIFLTPDMKGILQGVRTMNG